MERVVIFFSSNIKYKKTMLTPFLSVVCLTISHVSHALALSYDGYVFPHESQFAVYFVS